ncbi:MULTISPECIES: response regulator [Desulfatibacillum]|jgi:DNA-binding NtrC family response regulator|uniref:Response regulator receiver domain protein (CheY-like) n=2 Tax=Desulfatibacillum TaxID=218207 RepID=B8FKZ1_DESAL|nr:MULTISPECIES: response regulator [Desulfatibacillum]ACL04626.1 Response regulator receiver domain protein (CheY-like) [Desulfatibacillum aliphaticivorans]SHJ08046.1 Response regulator receiver domain-containing protein [Desulfatibacillum alkenivorans DSM 16219]
MSQGKVLLVDDNEDFLDILSERITSKGLEVETAESGTAALANPSLGSYDAVILDLVMPGMDGIETLKKMLAANPELQVILMTGHASLEKGIEAVKLGAMDFLEKPAEIQSLMEKIKEAQAKKMLLVEKKNEDKIREIVFTKGW